MKKIQVHLFLLGFTTKNKILPCKNYYQQYYLQGFLHKKSAPKNSSVRKMTSSAIFWPLWTTMKKTTCFRDSFWFYERLSSYIISLSIQAFFLSHPPPLNSHKFCFFVKIQHWKKSQSKFQKQSYYRLSYLTFFIQDFKK